MQYVSLLLTLVLAALFFYVATAGRRLDERHTGPLICRVPARASGLKRVLLIALGLAVVAPLGLTYVMVIDGQGSVYCDVAFVFNLVMMTCNIVLVSRLPFSLMEIRARGLVMYGGGHGPWGLLVPWRDVRYCKWKDTSGTLFVQCRGSNFERRVPPGLVDAVAAALTGRAEVRGPDDEPIAPPPEAAAELEPAGPVPERRRLQFRLSTLLLLAAVVAAASGFVGLRLGRERQRQAAVEGLQPFLARVEYEGTEVVAICVGWSATMTDADLAALARCPKLRRLELHAANVTDAGLAYLEGLDGLEYIDLRGTSTTREGVERLRRALPRATIEESNFAPPTPATPPPGEP